MSTHPADDADVAAAVTALFVPGSRPDRFTKAAATRADVVIIDLEDAVPDAERESALAATTAALAPGQGLRAVVRVVGTDSPVHDQQRRALLALAGRAGHGLAGVLLAKAERPDELAGLVADFVPVGSAVLGLVESAVGLQRCDALAAVPGLTRLALGELDLALDLGLDDPDSLTLAHARARLVIDSRAAGLAAPLGSPCPDLHDAAVIDSTARAARSAGFGGLLCVHPDQVAPVRDAFLPSDAQLAWARSVVDAGDGVAEIDGRMVDRPVLERARRILGHATER